MKITTKVEIVDIASVSPMLEQKKKAVLKISVDGKLERETILSQGSMNEVQVALSNLSFSVVEGYVNSLLREITQEQRYRDNIRRINSYEVEVPVEEEPKPKRAPRKKPLTDK